MVQALSTGSVIAEVLAADEDSFLKEWVDDARLLKHNTAMAPEPELRLQCANFLASFRKGVQSGVVGKASDPQWDDLRGLLADVSKSRALQGFTAIEIAAFVFSFKKPLYHRLRQAEKDPLVLASQIWETTELLDSFGLYATELWLDTREAIIRRQQEEMLELSTPVIKLWHNILALPLIGTLDSARTQVVMESLLGAIVETNSRVAILDITGVPTVDTVVAQHLLKTVTAARLMGAECIISGIRPQIAQTIVHLGINLLDITTKATLRDAFALALERTGQSIRSEEAPVN